MTAQPTGLTTVASVLLRGGNLSAEARLVRDADRVGETTEAESMAVETQDAADADRRGVLEVRREYPVLFEQEVEFPLQVQEGPEPPPCFDRDLYATTTAECDAYRHGSRAASTFSLAAGEGPDVTQPAPPEGTPDYPGDPWQAPSRDQWIGALGAILAGITVVFAVIGFCDVLRMMFGK